MAYAPQIYKSMMSALNGPSHPCHYQVIITPPPGLLFSGGIAGGAMSIAGALAVSLSAERAELPGRQLATTDHIMYGTKVKMPYAALYDDLSITFLCTNIMVQRAFFDMWQSYIHNPFNNYMRYYDNYVGTITITKLAADASVFGLLSLVHTYVFYECYPVTVQAQEVSYENGSDYLRLTVQFAYKKWSTPLDTLLNSVGGLPGPSVVSGNLPSPNVGGNDLTGLIDTAKNIGTDLLKNLVPGT